MDFCLTNLQLSLFKIVFDETVISKDITSPRELNRIARSL
jgi:hypothetical protein